MLDGAPRVVVVTFSEPIVSQSTSLVAGDFEVSVDGVTASPVSSINVRFDGQLELRLPLALEHDQSARLSYEQSSFASRRLLDAAGNAVLTFSLMSIENSLSKPISAVSLLPHASRIAAGTGRSISSRPGLTSCGSAAI